MTFREALDIRPGDIISVVGGGGKTTIMFALARELVSDNDCVITTTTTKIFEPLPSETSLLLLETNEEEMIRLLLQNMDKHRHITLAREKLTLGKLSGIRSELVGKLAELKQVAYVIIEADGAAHRSLKEYSPSSLMAKSARHSSRTFALNIETCGPPTTISDWQLFFILVTKSYTLS